MMASTANGAPELTNEGPLQFDEVTVTMLFDVALAALLAACGGAADAPCIGPLKTWVCLTAGVATLFCGPDTAFSHSP